MQIKTLIHHLNMGSSVLAIVAQIMVMSIIVAFILLSIGVCFLVLLHIYVVGKVFTRGLSTITRRDDFKDERRNGLTASALEMLPCFEFINGGEINDCVVCLEGFEEGERCRLLPICRHSFHAHCVDPWLVMTPICPICRTRACEKNKGIELRENGMLMIGFNESS